MMSSNPSAFDGMSDGTDAVHFSAVEDFTRDQRLYISLAFAVLRQFVLLRTVFHVVFVLRPSFRHGFTCVSDVDLMALYAVYRIYAASGLAGTAFLYFDTGTVVFVDDRFLLVNLFAQLTTLAFGEYWIFFILDIISAEKVL